MERVLTTTHLQCTSAETIKDEKGVITVEACTSLMIFIFAFYILLEALKLFAVQICMQDLTTAVVLEASMTTYYEDKVNNQYQSMSNLCSYDYQDGRLEIADSIINTNAGYDTSFMAIADYYMEDTNNIYRLAADENVEWFNLDVRVENWGSEKRIVANCEYCYRLFDIPFMDNEGICMIFEPVASSFAWTD